MLKLLYETLQETIVLYFLKRLLWGLLPPARLLRPEMGGFKKLL